MKKYLAALYIIIFTGILLVPSLGTLLKGPSDAENNDDIPLPSIRTEEGAFNFDYLSLLGSYFESRFAFRKEFVTGYSLITGKVFDTSSQSGVVTGTDGWLYYADTLGDFQRTEVFTARQLFDSARHLYLVNEYCENNGIEFLFVVAPNKNTLYPDNMPYYYPAGQGDSNVTLLMPMLSDYDIPHLYLYQSFNEAGDVYYFERDSHWNNRGAAVAADSILSALNVPHIDYRFEPYELLPVHEGDLESMIYPEAVTCENDYVYEREHVFTYIDPVESNFDYRISTEGEGGQKLLMYRDSFGSSLLPFMAEAFSHAFFSRSDACQINDVIASCPDILIVMKAERFIPQLCLSPSRLPAPLRELSSDFVPVEPEGLNIAAAGDYVTITGTLPEDSYRDDSIILIRAGEFCYEAFPVSDERRGREGFQALLEKNAVSTDNIMVFVD